MTTTDPRRRTSRVRPVSPAARRAAAARRRRRLLGWVLVLAVAAVGGFVLNERLTARLVPAGCRIAGADGASLTYDPGQSANAATISTLSVRRRLPERAATIALATAMQESKLRNLAHGDRDSLGLFQQRPSQGWGTPEQIQDPVYATNAFYRHLARVEGYLDLPLTVAAQRVQRSGYPEAYAKHEPNASTLAAAFTGSRPQAVACRLDPPASARSASRVVDDIEAQLGVRARATEHGVVAVVSTPRLAWALGSWGVAHAERIGATSVTVGDRRWTRGRGEEATSWRQVDTAAQATEVTITLAPAR